MLSNGNGNRPTSKDADRCLDQLERDSERRIDTALKIAEKVRRELESSKPPKPA